MRCRLTPTSCEVGTAPARMHDLGSKVDGGNNSGNNTASVKLRCPTQHTAKCLKQQQPALVCAGRCRLRSRRSRVRIAAGASKDQAPAGFVGASPSYGKTVAETLAKHTPRRRGRVPCADARVTRSLSAVR